jgi:hypothetical protein
VARVNVAGWCGKNDWRMPTRKELQGIVSYDRVAPTIDTAYFPNTPANSIFWSGSPNSYFLYEAWNVNFNFGNSISAHRNDVYHVRLVRGGQ